MKVTVLSVVLHGSTPQFLLRRSVASFLTLYYAFCSFWPHCSCHNDQVTSNMAPAHPPVTVVAVYLALLKGTVSFTVLAMIPVKEGTRMLMSYECGDNAIVESQLPSMLLSQILSITMFSWSLVDDIFPKSCFPVSCGCFSRVFFFSLSLSLLSLIHI